jgi:cell division protein FtsQ
MINVDEAAVAARLTRLPWVFSVTVSRHWPHSVSIAITERHPVAIAVRGDNYDLVANDGTDLGVAPVGTDLPRLVTAAGGWPFTGSQNDLVVVAGSLPRAFSAQVARISQEPNSGIRLEMTTPVTFILGPASNLTAKYQDVAAVLAHEHLAAGDVVDVTVPTAVAISGP